MLRPLFFIIIRSQNPLLTETLPNSFENHIYSFFHAMSTLLLVHIPINNLFLHIDFILWTLMFVYRKYTYIFKCVCIHIYYVSSRTTAIWKLLGPDEVRYVHIYSITEESHCPASTVRQGVYKRHTVLLCYRQQD